MKLYLVLFSLLMSYSQIQALRILCIGDSLTYGQGGDGITWPSVLSELSGAETINRGRSGWIPRHLMYAYLLEDDRCLTGEALRHIPMSDLERRQHQGTINNRRVFIRGGQTVVATVDGALKQFRWDPNSTESIEDGIRPIAQDDPPPESGQWLVEPNVIAVLPTEADICVLWIGANGMEAADVGSSLKTIVSRFQAEGGKPVVILGLINRLHPTSHRKDIDVWAEWIQECNDEMRKLYPDRFLDLQAWFTSTGHHADGGYQTLDWFPNATPKQIADDIADQNLGVVPRSLRPANDKTHLNATGYRIVGTLVYRFLNQ